MLLYVGSSRRTNHRKVPLLLTNGYLAEEYVPRRNISQIYCTYFLPVSWSCSQKKFASQELIVGRSSTGFFLHQRSKRTKTQAWNSTQKLKKKLQLREAFSVKEKNLKIDRFFWWGVTCFVFLITKYFRLPTFWIQYPQTFVAEFLQKLSAKQ